MANGPPLDASLSDEIDPLAEYEASFSSDRVLVASLLPCPGVVMIAV